MNIINKLANFKSWKRVRIRYSGKREYCFVVPATNGSIVMQRNGKFYVRNQYRRNWQLVSSGIFALYRMLCHVERGYGQEILKLEQISEAMTECNVNLVGMRKDSSFEGKMKDKLAALAHKLERVRNEFKKRGCQQIIFCLPLRDSKGRFNIGVFQARTVAARNRFHERLGEIGSIQPWITMRKETIRMLINVFTFGNRELETLLEAVYNSLSKNRPGYTSGAMMRLERAVKKAKEINHIPMGLAYRQLAPALKYVHGNISEIGNDQAVDILRGWLSLVRQKNVLEQLAYRVKTIDDMLQSNTITKQPLLKMLSRFYNELGKIAKSSSSNKKECQAAQSCLQQAIEIIKEKGRLNYSRLSKAKGHLKTAMIYL